MKVGNQSSLNFILIRTRICQTMKEESQAM